MRGQRQDKFKVRLIGKVGSRPANGIPGACLRNALSPQKTHHKKPKQNKNKYKVNKHRKTCSLPLVNTEMKKQSTPRFHITLVKTAIVVLERWLRS